MTLKLTIVGNGLPRFSEAVEALGSTAKAQRAFRRALNEAGRDTTAPTYRALAKQTGLKIKTTRKALRPTKATTTNLEFTLRGSGGFIGLKYFGARETRAGVTAAPFGSRQLYGGTWIKGGLWPSRKTLSFGGQVMKPQHLWSTEWGRKFKKAKSDVRIPDEMVKGITADAFNTIGLVKLSDKVNRHIKLVTKGVLS